MLDLILSERGVSDSCLGFSSLPPKYRFRVGSTGREQKPRWFGAQVGLSGRWKWLREQRGGEWLFPGEGLQQPRIAQRSRSALTLGTSALGAAARLCRARRRPRDGLRQRPSISRPRRRDQGSGSCVTCSGTTPRCFSCLLFLFCLVVVLNVVWASSERPSAALHITGSVRLLRLFTARKKGSPAAAPGSSWGGRGCGDLSCPDCGNRVESPLRLVGRGGITKGRFSS